MTVSSVTSLHQGSVVGYDASLTQDGDLVHQVLRGQVSNLTQVLARFSRGHVGDLQVVVRLQSEARVSDHHQLGCRQDQVVTPPEQHV